MRGLGARSDPRYNTAIRGNDGGEGMSQRATATEPFNNVARYEALMDVVRTRMTNRF